MSKIVNEPENRFPVFVKVREQLEHRALWLSLLVEEAEKRGLDADDFAAAAVKRCGLSQGAGIVEKSGTKGLKGLRKALFTKAPGSCSRWTWWNAPTTGSRSTSTTARL